MDVDVVIPTLNSASRLPEVVRRVKENLRPMRVIVVDGGSNDATQAVAKDLGCEVMVDKVSLGSSRMTGIRACTSELVGFVDDDIYIGDGFREKMMAHFDEKTGAVQGIALLTDPGARERSLEHIEKRFAGRAFLSLGRNERGYTNATLVRRELLLDLDISDMDAYEDLVIARHIIDKGFVWKVVPVYVDHDHRARANLYRSAWNYAGVWNLGRTGRLTFGETVRMFARFAYSHQVEIVHALRTSNTELLKTQTKLLLGAIVSPLFVRRRRVGT
jgi:glycosyltransferase involved in cell wall biosynthesis